MSIYYKITNEDRIFLSEEEAIAWDFKNNPEYHYSKEHSYIRIESAIYELSQNELYYEELIQ